MFRKSSESMYPRTKQMFVIAHGNDANGDACRTFHDSEDLTDHIEKTFTSGMHVLERGWDIETPLRDAEFDNVVGWGDRADRKVEVIVYGDFLQQALEYRFDVGLDDVRWRVGDSARFVIEAFPSSQYFRSGLNVDPLVCCATSKFLTHYHKYAGD